MKKFIKIYMVPLITILSLPLLLSILNLFGIKTYNSVILFIMLVISVIGGYKTGKTVNKKGYINGLLFGFIFTLFLFLLSLFYGNHYGLNNLVYYVIIILSFIIGSMFGIQKKE